MQRFWQGTYCVGNEWNTAAKIKEVSLTKEGRKKNCRQLSDGRQIPFLSLLSKGKLATDLQTIQ